MKITKSLFHAGVLGLSLLATSVIAAVPQAEADKLGKSLTPMGAEMAGNADGSIPAWKALPTFVMAAIRSTVRVNCQPLARSIPA